MSEPQNTPTHETTLAELETTLAGLVASHETLLDLTTRHRAAITRADAAELTAVITAQEEELRVIATLEQRRRAAARALEGGVARRAPEPTLTQALSNAAQPVRERVSALAEKLRGLLGRIIRERNVVKQATASLVGHMEGLMRQVAQSLSASGAYARTGRVEAPTQPIVTGLDITS